MSNLVLSKMTTDEAQSWKSSVGCAASQLRILLFDGYERGAWEALGYANWTECVKALAEEFSISERHLWRLHAANESENLLTPGSVGRIPEKALRPLTSLPPEQQRVVYEKAVETAPNGKPTAAHVEATVRSVLPLAAPIKLQPVPASTFVSPKPAGEVVRSEMRFVPARPFIGTEYEEMAEEFAEDEDGYEYQNDEDEEDYSEFDTVTVTDASGSEEAITVTGGIAGITEALEIANEVKTNGMAVHFSSKSPEHYTPQEIIDAAVAVLCEIDLDPCSNSKDTPNIPALDHYTAEDNGLLMPWFGRVYMNPPYGRGANGIAAWVTKLASEYEMGNVAEAIALVPGRIDTQWWQTLRSYPACFVTGRLTFVGNEDSAPFPSVVFYLGENSKRFYEVFSDLGDIWIRVDEHWFTD